MKKICILCNICILLFSLVSVSQASVLSDNAHLMVISKQNLHPTGTRPTSSDVKYAATYFISNINKSNFGLNVKMECPDGEKWYKGHCEKVCDENAYPLTKRPPSSMCSDENIMTCESFEGTRYACLGCNDGWLKNESTGECIINTCDSSLYPYTEISLLGGMSCIDPQTCFSGEKKYFGCNECKQPGYVLSQRKCVLNQCEGYRFTNKIISGCKQVSEVCYSGDTAKYKCTTCYNGYVKNNNGECNKTCTYTKTSLPTNCKLAASCVLESATESRTYYNSSCTTCNTGYELKQGACVKSCTYTQTSLPANCKTAASCTGTDAKTYYATTCTTCNAGYELKNGSCVAKSCTGYTSTSSSISGCTTKGELCQSGSQKLYRCTSCESGYEVDESTGLCQKMCDADAARANGYTFTQEQRDNFLNNSNDGRYGDYYKYAYCYKDWYNCNLYSCATYYVRPGRVGEGYYDCTVNGDNDDDCYEYSDEGYCKEDAAAWIFKHCRSYGEDWKFAFALPDDIIRKVFSDWFPKVCHEKSWSSFYYYGPEYICGADLVGNIRWGERREGNGWTISQFRFSTGTYMRTVWGNNCCKDKGGDCWEEDAAIGYYMCAKEVKAE